MPDGLIEQPIREHLRYNIVVNLMDGAFFGFALGFGSFVTIIPLFVSQMTSSAILIGLIPAIHSVGWQFPQLLTAGWVSRLRRYKPAALVLTIQERIPFLGLAMVAWLLPTIGKPAALLVTFILLIWQGLGGGFTANPWTSMISKIIPSEIRGTFFGAQSAAANALASVSAVIAGLLLERLGTPLDFTTCFLLTAACLVVSWFFLSLTREPEDTEKIIPAKRLPFWVGTRTILRRDVNFRWFLLVRILSQFASMGFSFYIVYAVRRFSMNEVTAGLLTSIYMISQIIANPLMGWLGDRWSHRGVMEFGALAAMLSAALAWKAPTLGWFYPIFFLAGLAVVAIWTIGMAMMVEFGTEVERPVYIGLANTLIAPATILAPLFGGWLADVDGYPTTFAATAVMGIAMLGVLHFLVHDPKKRSHI